jgi:hypothetical protein
MRNDLREALALRLAIDPEFIVTAYEDPLAYVLKERDLRSMSILR